MRVRKRIRVYGIVQGVGFRPFVSRAARQDGLAGSVCNKGPYVEIFIEGTEEASEIFLHHLTEKAPERSSILKVETQDFPAEGEEEFRIIRSAKVKGDIFVSPDIAICDKCAAELYDPKNRRYLHPFINCTACGPRLTILDSMPYDRVRTSMGKFPMCPDCEYEYTHPSTRRYHAQPVCCRDCGPHLSVIGSGERDAEAILKTRRVIREGGIAAVKGIGGFHLCCDASNAEAVRLLRQRKHRPMKPLAVMLKNMDTVRRECLVEDGQEEILTGPQKPILLLKKKTGDGTRICRECAPDNAFVGIMLPYAPVQLLLFDYPPDPEGMTDCFVMTSGNPKGAPICMNDAEAEKELSGICDIILTNDRDIRIRADDSVMAWHDGKPYMIRRSRGYAPLPFLSSEKIPHRVLAVGGELKNTFCLATGELYYPSPYIGDMADLRSAEALSAAVTRMENLLETEPEAVAVDMHPRYNSSAFGREYAAAHSLPVFEVQHHWAHIAACLAENDFRGKAIGVSFDGTGYGSDGTIWGGEFLLADLHSYRRLGAIDPFPQAGGDLAAKEGWRVAVSLILKSMETEEEAERTILSLQLCSPQELKLQKAMIRGRINCVTSTSAGRLFDAISAVLGIRRQSTFEGEASMALEYEASRWAEEHPEKVKEPEAEEKTECGIFKSSFENRPFFTMDTAALIRRMAKGRENGEDRGKLAYIFHRSISDMIVRGCEECRKMTQVTAAALSGGVMQNLLLLGMCEKGLAEKGFQVLEHSLTPANDGGIALGQAAVAMEKMKGE
ncbi:MAG: carbamoyltransferase HypF [Lachnospiraceae bacterium]|jgi:hydrogenase maturation protein HypF|nr:carbamoyltransferase HypF [Lachnospiraceae bacterium]MCI1726540.1 carbamoyltransferase HypF [Lachnospiraceae bacterium]